MLICMPTGARARDRAVVYLCVYSPASWEARIGGVVLGAEGSRTGTLPSHPSFILKKYSETMAQQRFKSKNDQLMSSQDVSVRIVSPPM